MENGASSYLRFLNGDKEGFVDIVRQYKDGLTLFVNTIMNDIHISEEVANEVFLRLYVKKPKYKSEYSFKTWLYTIGKNKEVLLAADVVGFDILFVRDIAAVLDGGVVPSVLFQVV